MKKILNYKGIVTQRILTIILLVSTCFIIMTSLGSNTFQKTVEAIPFDVKWTVVKDGSIISDDVTLPYEFDKNETGTYNFTTTIPKINFKTQMLIFKAYYKDIWVYIDGELFFEHVFVPTALNDMNPGTGDVRIILPTDSAGKTLEIKLKSLVCAKNTYFNVPEIRDASQNVFSLSISDMAILFIMLAFLFIAVLLIIIYFIGFTSEEDRKSCFYLAIFFASTAIWTLCYTCLIELYIDNWSLTLNLEYLAVYAMPMSLWLLYGWVWGQNSSITKFMKVVVVGFYTIVLLSNILLKIPFVVFLSVFHTICLITIFVLSLEIFRNAKGQPLSYKLFGIGIESLFLAALVGIFEFYVFPDENKIGWLFVGALASTGIFLVLSVSILTLEVIKNHFKKAISKNQETEYLRYENLLCNLGYTFFDWDTESNRAYISNNFKDFFGQTIDENDFPNSLFQVMPCLNEDNQIFNVAQKLNEGSEHEKIEGTFTDGENKKIHFSMDLTSNYDSNGNRTRVIGIIKDTTEKIKLEEEHFKQMQYIDINRQLYDNVLEADIENNILLGDATEEFANYLGLEKDISFSGIIKGVTEKITHPDFVDEYLKNFSRERIMSLYESGIESFQTETYELSVEGNYEWLQLNVVIYKSKVSDSVCITSYVQNITKIKERELALVESSTRDFLSKLLNKGASLRCISQVLEESNPEKDSHALFIIDIDEFKSVNDILGHATGDKVIIDVSQKLKSIFSEIDIVGRFGGDEFVAFVRNANDVEAIREKCSQLNREVYLKYSDGNKSTQISLSIGVACYPKDGIDYEGLCANADRAMYKSKKSGRNRFTIYGD